MTKDQVQEAQDLLNAIAAQREGLANQLAQAQAQNAALQRRISTLEREAAAAASRAKIAATADAMIEKAADVIVRDAAPPQHSPLPNGADVAVPAA